MSRILIVDDVAAMADQYAYDLKRLGGHEVTVATSGVAALARIEHQPFDCVILDLEMPGMDGFAVLENLRHRGIDVPVIVYTGTGNFARCVQAVSMGAVGFIDKAEPMERVVLEVANAVERARLTREVATLRDRLGESRLIGRSRAIEQLRQLIARVAPAPTTVLIEGESGTGKEVVAQELHRLSRTPNGPLVAINCAALPEQLVESELFGHEKGAFTGATGLRRGAFEAADGGTLFLDEIGELPAAAQAKFLRVLEQRTVVRVGATKAEPINVRVIAATNRSLDQLVAEGAFREDLFYRLNTIRLVVPPLRDRPEDVVSLADYFLVEICRRFRVLPKQLSGEAKAALTHHSWRRNNVRELRNAMERAVVLADGALLRLEHLPEELGGSASSPPAANTWQDQKTAAERRIILAALEANDWHVSQTAESLGLADHASLLKIIRRLEIRRP